MMRYRGSFDELSTKPISGARAESDTYEERWERFEKEDALDAAWFESEERRRKLERLERLLEDEEVKSADERKVIIRGLKDALGYFSRVQLNELHRLIKRIGEGLAVREGRELFEKSSKAEELDSTSITSSGVDRVSQLLFDQLLERFYEIVAHAAISDSAEAHLMGIIKVGWNSVQECAKKVEKALAKKKPLTHIQLLIFPFQKQLDAIDPEHPFLGTVGD